MLIVFGHQFIPCIENLQFCADTGHTKSEEQPGLAEDVSVEAAATTGANKTNEDDTKTPYLVWPYFLMYMPAHETSDNVLTYTDTAFISVNTNVE